ncbi:MAG: hypothetical protein UR34_C0005G0013 [candidate division WS6 bacterium GW2011_GWC1_33_20]|uniref:Uncharacterized protein n=2 Tax=Candidatus Dojkabacteria TaxID=74243 RepID=A0A0G0AE76_9BACT|nr:MAG: hypothetical protein UR32_C0002G0015 [candidate division WS6 bacterium GW2011_GWE2_33_157]KKP44190.1 MAG: hypothetical protein UR34_C0005G0013 [candidate division WS6 bacterium GW2011_GWC1_33_20]KKP45754.1 MAG: hypothetical protein UR36_C0004G0015 [candidate division WS6 bacterium GW2011_GWF1_33_233]KKP55084.1 MAG: hypothetical protein UR47_C0005G0013 [candidate division WS6 bacterium GW2011_GWB1_33_6]KKP55197.1 MAG: hypothetical protein UR45_C0003G0015 [candidate division WS6 bacterium
MLNAEDIFKEKSDDFSSGQSRSFRDSPSERVPMIEAVYDEVLGRKPSSRELAYYKYGVLEENEIRIKLLKSEEHKKIIENSSKVPGLESELRDLRITEKKLVQGIDDYKSEISQSQNLLNEKNAIILELREQVKNPYDLPSKIEKYEAGFDVFNSNMEKRSQSEKRKGLKESIKDLIELFVK